MRSEVLALVVALSWVTAVSADQPGAVPTGVSTAATGEYSREGILTALEIDHDLWLEAQLGGDHDQVARIEKELIGLLNSDIYSHQEQVREMAKDMVMSSVPGSDTAETLAAADSLISKADLQDAINTLNAKEALCRSLKRTNAFSNKYRLLGDYIDLLRRELEMPRLKMAVSKAPVDDENVNETTTPAKK